MSKEKKANKLPNPFETARRVCGITVLLRPEDVSDVWNSISPDGVARLFSLHGERIASVMLAAGVTAAVEIIKQEGDLK